MKTTLVLCVFAMIVALALGSGGGDHGGHGDDGHGAAGGHGGGHGDDGGHGGGHDAGHGDSGHGSASALQMCSTLFSFAVLAALNKLW